MDNQVNITNISCFSPVSVFLGLLYKKKSVKTSKQKDMSHKLNVDICKIILKGLLPVKKKALSIIQMTEGMQ